MISCQMINRLPTEWSLKTSHVSFRFWICDHTLIEALSDPILVYHISPMVSNPVFVYWTLDWMSAEPPFKTSPIYYELLNSTINFRWLIKDNVSSWTYDPRSNEPWFFHGFNFTASVFSYWRVIEIIHCIASHQGSDLWLLNHWLKVSRRLKLHLLGPSLLPSVAETQTKVWPNCWPLQHFIPSFNLQSLIWLLGCFLLNIESSWYCLIKARFNTLQLFKDDNFCMQWTH